MAIPAPLSVDNLERGCAVVVSTAAVPRYRTSPRREAWRCLCVAMAAIVLAACGSKPTVPQKIEMEFEVTTAGSINLIEINETSMRKVSIFSGNSSIFLKSVFDQHNVRMF